MKNLGKILLIFLSPIYLLASVVATVDSTTVTRGESVTLNLNISGEDIKKPEIDTICGYDVLSTSSQTSITMINGDYKKSYTLSYKFLPLNSCEIQPIEVEIDSIKQKTKPIKITVQKQVSNKNSEFVLLLKTDKKDVLVGESFNVDLIFKQKKGASAVDSKFKEPNFKGFWVKNRSDQVTYEDGDFNVIKITYTLSAQREGRLSILPASIAIAKRDNSSRDSWGMLIQDIKWKTYLSNALDIDVKPLPKGVKYIGDFKISVDVDKITINKNEPLNLTLNIVGDGNLEDIQSFKPSIDGVTVYDEKIIIKGNKLTQKMAFVSDNDFIIKPFVLKYFDIKTKKVKVIKTKEIKVTVTGTKVKENLVVKKDTTLNAKAKPNIVVKKGISNTIAVVIFIFGLLVGIGIMLLKPFKIDKNTKKKFDIKNEKLLLIKLLPFKDDVEVKNIIDTLESNIYSVEKKDIDKKILKQIIEKYKI
ncbi:MAG: BatD family protein [Campylobacterales bacterium]